MTHAYRSHTLIPVKVSGPLAFRSVGDNTPPVKMTVTELTEQMIASYARVGGINRLDEINLPSKTAITSITEELLQLLFPGFFTEKPIHSYEIKMETANLMDAVLGQLEDEIYKSLLYIKRDPGRARSEATEITMTFLSRLPHLRELLQTDSEAAFNGDPAALSKDEIIVAYPFIEAIAVQRLAHELYKLGVVLIPRIMTEWAHARTGIDIHPGAIIGSHFFIDHGTGTVIGETCQIGDRVKLYQNVSLVARSLAAGQALKGVKRHPTIEDNVTIYAGATIIGGETVIGANSTIGANVFLLNSVPPNSLVIYEEVNVKILPKQDKTRSSDFQI
jgi:serine O-acetyltransferase